MFWTSMVNPQERLQAVCCEFWYVVISVRVGLHVYYTCFTWCNKHRNMWAVIGDKYTYLTYYEYLVGMKLSD